MSVEDERMGAMADDVKSSTAEAGHEALDRGKHVAEQAGSAALDAARRPAASKARNSRRPCRRRLERYEPGSEEDCFQKGIAEVHTRLGPGRPDASESECNTTRSREDLRLRFLRPTPDSNAERRADSYG